MPPNEELNLTLPGNPRYQPPQLKGIFGYDMLYHEAIRVEIAVMRTLAEIKVIPNEEIALLTQEVEQALLAITTTEVDAEERRTKHDVRALVNCIKRRIPEPLQRWVHIPLTSYDVLDTARALQFGRAYDEALQPALKQVVQSLTVLVCRHAETLQIGRTHGQHAIPITVGFWLATILSRIVDNWEMLDKARDGLVGKISGAVGAYNAQVGLGIEKPDYVDSFEHSVLSKLYIVPAPISTQIVPPEPLAHFLWCCVLLTGAIEQLGCDCRHLMRSEIGEIGEDFTNEQSGSSTMAHKHNPITFEQLVGMDKKNLAEFVKVMETLVSEHQRDLTGSSVMRDFPIIVINLMMQLNALTRPNDDTIPFLERIHINTAACQRNFALNKNVILAEPMYIALQMAGYQGDAHALVNHVLVPNAQTHGVPLMDVLSNQIITDVELEKAVQQIPVEVMHLLEHPEEYIGLATQKALAVAERAENLLFQM